MLSDQQTITDLSSISEELCQPSNNVLWAAEINQFGSKISWQTVSSTARKKWSLTKSLSKQCKVFDEIFQLVSAVNVLTGLYVLHMHT